MPFKNIDFTLTLPEGAGPGEPRIVIGTKLPPPLDVYEYKNVDPIAGAMLFYPGNTDDDFLFLGIVNDTVAAPDRLTLLLGAVRNAAVVEEEPGIPSGTVWWLEPSTSNFMGLDHLGGSVQVPFLRVRGLPDGGITGFMNISNLAEQIAWSMIASDVGSGNVPLFFMKRVADTVASWALQGNGQNSMFWGSGTSALDVGIGRSATRTLSVSGIGGDATLTSNDIEANGNQAEVRVNTHPVRARVDTSHIESDFGPFNDALEHATDIITVPIIAGRVYWLEYYSHVASTVDNDDVMLRIREGNGIAGNVLQEDQRELTADTQSTAGIAFHGVAQFPPGVLVGAPSTEIKTFTITGQRRSGTGAWRIEASASKPHIFWIDDLGLPHTS